MTIATFPPEPPPQSSWKRYFGFCTDAKVIGIQYIVTAFFFFLIGSLLAMVIGGGLITPAAAARSAGTGPFRNQKEQARHRWAAGTGRTYQRRDRLPSCLCQAENHLSRHVH